MYVKVTSTCQNHVTCKHRPRHIKEAELFADKLHEHDIQKWNLKKYEVQPFNAQIKHLLMRCSCNIKTLNPKTDFTEIHWCPLYI